MTSIRAIDEIVLPYPTGPVWSVLFDVSKYPQWWPRSVGLRLLHETPTVVGTELQIRPLGGRAFRCRVDSYTLERKIQMRYFGGFIEGSGEWRLEPLSDGTRVQYELDVTAAGLLVACIGRVLPLARFHSLQMQSVLKRLRKRVASQC